MTKYFCRKCNARMENINENVGIFRLLVKCPKCGIEIIIDHEEDLG